MSRLAALAAAAMLGWGAACWADEGAVRLAATADPLEVMVGEPVRYRLVLEYPEGMDADPPVLSSTLGEGWTVEESGAEPPRVDEGRVTVESWYRLSIYETGAHTIPEPVAAYRGADGGSHEVRGSAVTIAVHSLLPTDWESQDIREVKPLVRLGGHWWVWAAGLLALLAGAAAIWWTRRRAAEDDAGPPPRPAHEIALEALAQLERDALPAKNRFDEYYVRLSNIVRAYVEGRFGLRAPEMTTEEFLRAAARAVALGSTHRDVLQGFLTYCDLVKFAKYRPSASEAEDGLRAATRFVQETVPAPEPVIVGRR